MTRHTTPSRTTALLMVALTLPTFAFLASSLSAEEPKVDGAVSTPINSETPSAAVPVHSASVPPTAAISVKQPQHQRNIAELTALRDEVRGLREDVRRLSELLEKRLAEKAPAPPVAIPKPEPVVKTPLAPIEDGLLFFNATWCGPSQQMQPVIEKLVREGHPVRNVDVEKEPELFPRFRVVATPCCVFISAGREVDRITGLTDEKLLRSRLKKPAAKPGEFDLILTQGQAAIHSFRRPAGVIEPAQDDHLTITRLTPTDYHFKSEKVGDVTLQVLYEGENKPSPLRVQVLANSFEQQLSRKISLKLDKTPLHQAIGEIGLRLDANFVLDKAGLTHDGLSVETPVTLNVSEVSVRSVLELLLKPLHMTFVVENEVIKITTQARAAGPLVVLTYSIADLLTAPPEKLNEEQGPVDAARKDSAPNDAAALKPTIPSPTKQGEQLVKLIQKTVDPDSWDVVGGLGSICLHDSTLSLVVRQTKPSHAEIARVLNSLRRVQAKVGGNFDFGSLVNESRKESSDRAWRQLGLRLEPLVELERPALWPKYRGGMKVIEVQPDSTAASNGILKDDVLVGLDKWETTSFENVSFSLNQPGDKEANGGRRVKFYVLRGGETRYGFLPLDPQTTNEATDRSKYTPLRSD